MKRCLLIVVVLLAPAFSWAQDAVQRGQHEMHQLHQNAKAYIEALEDPKRDAYQKPHQVLAALDLKPGEVIADIGAGSGYFSFRLAQHVGVNGRVYAVDINPDMIIHMNRRIRDLNLKNVVTILADPDDPLLSDGSVDLFFFSESWHHIENQSRYLARIKKMLKPGGKVAMIDFQKRDTPVGPPMAMRIAREDLLRQMQSNGFRLVKEHSFLPYQYFLVFGLK